MVGLLIAAHWCPVSAGLFAQEGTGLNESGEPEKRGPIRNEPGAQQGYTMFAPFGSDHAFLVDMEGTFLLIAWEHKSNWEAIETGRDPALIGKRPLWPDHALADGTLDLRASEANLRPLACSS